MWLMFLVAGLTVIGLVGFTFVMMYYLIGSINRR